MHNFNNRIDFGKVKHATQRYQGVLLRRILHRAIKQEAEYVSLNPTRPDRNLGSFRINVYTYQWADFATGDKGGDIISL